MIRNAVITTAIAVMAGNALGADYMFPTAYPSGVDLDTVKQIVTFIWDDNAYSGLDKTDYETEPGQLFPDHNWVGGMKPWENAPKGAPNTLDLHAGDFGMSWAISGLVGAELPPKLWKPGAVYIKDETVLKDQKIYKAHTRIENSVTAFGGIDPATITMEVKDWSNGGAIKTIGWDEMAPYQRTEALAKANAQWVLVKDFDPAGTKTNPDGTPIQFTFNVISGLFVPIFDNPAGGTGDGYRVSKYGSWQPNSVDLIEFPHLDAYKGSTQTIPVAWGREQMVKKNESDEGNVNGETYGCINDVFIYTKNSGHEIGNHTIDHLESNSALPTDERGFGRWGGEGFSDKMIETVSWGDTTFEVNEAEDFGRMPGISWHSIGWKPYAGRMLSKKAWKGLLELGEVDLEIALDIRRGTTESDIQAFRAPRLEVNSNLHYALKELGYTYDCGQEEGYEYHIDGKNFYWPYTTDNGSPNVSFQRSIGENVSIDSMPAGLWQIPVNAMIVPETIRGDVWSNYKVIATAEGHPQTAEDSTYWVNENGKITGFDFNMFILWGMTNENVLKTLKHNLDLRLIGGKAPMQIGSHTDYFTPIYDIATLLSDANRSTFGLCIDSGWNDWRGRISVYEDFIDYGITKDVYFWSGARTIDYVRKIAASDQYGTPSDFNKEWAFFNNSTTQATSNVQTATGTIEAAVTIPAKVGETVADAGFRTYFTAGTLAELDHISLNYKTTAPIAVKLIMENDQPWEVWLNSLGNDVQSGRIPLSAFHYNQYADETLATNKVPNPADIVGIELALLTSGRSEKTETLSIKDFKVYTGEKSVGIATEGTISANKAGLTFNGINAGKMNLSVAQNGVYNVGLFTLSGRMVKSIDAASLTSGINSVELGSMPAGMYVLRIQGENQNLVTKAMIQ